MNIENATKQIIKTNLNESDEQNKLILHKHTQTNKLINDGLRQNIHMRFNTA